MENPQSGDSAKPRIHLVRAENLPPPQSSITTCCSQILEPGQRSCEIPENAEICLACQKKQNEPPLYLKTFQFVELALKESAAA